MSAETQLENRQDEIVNRVVEKVLNQILGSLATQIIYRYLETNYFMQKDEIAENLDSFNRALEEYLGTGAAVIEKLIMSNLEVEESKVADFVGRSKILKMV